MPFGPGDLAHLCCQAAAVFYGSNKAEFITGTALLIGGGMTAGYLERERSPLGSLPRKAEWPQAWWRGIRRQLIN